MAILSPVARWGLTVTRRSFQHDFLHTLQGRVALACLLLAIPSLLKILGTGPSGMSELTRVEQAGALFWAQSSLYLAFGFTLGLALLKVFVIKPENRPAWNFPFILRELALYNFLVPSFLGATLFILLTFYLFFWRCFDTGVTRLAIPVHILLTTAQLFVLSVAIGGLLRHALRVGRVREQANLIVRVAVVPWMLSYAQMVAGVPLFREWRPSALSTLGSRAVEPWFVLQPSLSFVHALSTGRWSPAVVSLTMLAVLTACAIWCLARWYRVAHREIILDEGGPAAPVFSSAFAPERSRIPFPRTSVSGAFWVKDVLVPVRRSSSGYVQQIAFALSGALVAVIFLHFWGESRSTGAGVTCFILTLVTLAVPLIFSAHGCLASLGMEGTNIALLRPVLGIRRLLYAKSSAQLVFVLVHALVLASLIAGGAQLAGLPHPGFVPALGLSLAATLAFCAMGLALGFGLPDFHRKSMMLPGASKLAQFVHMAGGGGVAVGWSLLGAAFFLDRIGLAGLLAGVVVPLALLLGLSAAVGAWSLRQLERLEI